jgi:hypothetical protein
MLKSLFQSLAVNCSQCPLGAFLAGFSGVFLVKGAAGYRRCLGSRFGGRRGAGHPQGRSGAEQPRSGLTGEHLEPALPSKVLPGIAGRL